MYVFFVLALLYQKCEWCVGGGEGDVSVCARGHARHVLALALAGARTLWRKRWTDHVLRSDARD